ncbi:AraC family transcriptional regulator [Kitasatospora sp. NPDC101801]|uniref:AraC family transcriptional regulator n=1 Tax=Kitasatospora sp. NPDC101801 TaxID=3364103 RepID=UPI00381CA2D3
MVARRWGFVNPAHFSRVFRAAYGVSPREWRALRTAEAVDSAGVLGIRAPEAGAQGDGAGRSASAARELRW